MLCHVFKTGKHKDSNGNIKVWTTEDLDRICYQFQNIHKNVPICVGHPKTNSPAYGWINEVKRIGDNLYCSFKDVQDEFKTAFKKGLFKNRSISFDKDLNIRHLAFLGAQAPAIKGLEEFCFTDFKSDEIKTYEFKDFQDNKEVNVENQNIDELLKAKDDEILALKKQIEDAQRSQKTKEFQDFADNAIKNGKILPKHKECIVNILSVCDGADNFNFSDKENVSAVDTVKEFINSLDMKCFQDIAVKESASEKKDFSDAHAIAKELEKIMQEKNVDLTTAFKEFNK